MHKEDKAIEPGRMACLVPYDAMINGIRTPVILLTWNGIIGMAQCPRCIIHQLDIHLFRPRSNAVVIPLVGWKEVMSRDCGDAKMLNLLVILSEVGSELLFCHKQAIPLRPITIQQVFVAVWPKVITVSLQFLDD